MKFDHIALSVKDVERAIEWYTTHLNAIIEYRDSTWALLNICGTKIALTIPSQHPEHIAFCVKEVDQLPGKKDAIGTHRDGTKFVYVQDSEGNVIEFLYRGK